MSNTNSAASTAVGKPINGVFEQKLKQARLPFKSTTMKKNTATETGKKRKHEDDAENASQPAYIDLTEEKERSQSPSNADSDVKSSKVCIIQAGSKSDSATEVSDQPKATDSKPTDKCSLQKWFKPKKVEVTSDTKNDEKCDQIRMSNTIEEQSELMQVDEPIHSQHSDTLNAAEDNDISLVDDAVNDSVNLSTDVDVSENDRSFNKIDTSTPNTPTSKQNLKKKLTPKQKSKREEIELKRQEMERLKKEKEKKRLEEKEEKQRLKEEKERKRLAEIEAKNEEKRQKEEERKAKEEEKKRQKEEERRLKEDARKQKEEERKQKEEERKQKIEEKRQKEEQKRLKEEQERKLREKTAAAFTNFFVPKNKETPKENEENNDKSQRPVLSQESRDLLEEILQKNEGLPKDSLYLAVFKSKTYKPVENKKTLSTRTLDVTEDDDDVIIVDNENSLRATEKPMRYRHKLLQFHDNKRSAYWGTWRIKSKEISGKTPFEKYELFDYEVDSDEEWEDEPGEDLEAGSEDEKESEDDYEVDNDVFVPHGYLSEEEGQNDDGLDSSPKSNKLKLNVLERQFEEEMKEKTHKLKPRIFGCIWIANIVKSNEGDTCVENLLLSFRAVFNESKTPFCVPSESKEVTPQNTPSLKIKLKNEFPDSLLPDLVKMTHGNKKNTKLLAKEFNVYVLNLDETLNLTLSCITNKLKEISVWNSHLACRLVNDEIRNKCGLIDLSYTENDSKHITVGDKPFAKILKPELGDKSQTSGNLTTQSPSSCVVRENAKIKSSITKFVKVLTPEEKLLAFNEIILEKNEKQSISTSSPKPKPKNDITKFIKIGAAVDKNVESNNIKNTPPQTAGVIDLTENDSNPTKESSDEPAGDAKVAQISSDFQCAAENIPDFSSKSENKPVLHNTSHKSPSASKNTPNKSINILVPRKVPRSPTVNVLIPRKTPNRPLTSANSEMPPPSIFNFDEIKPEIKTFTPKRLLESLNKVNSSNSINTLVPKRAKDVKNSENSKPVNVLIPRRASDAKNTSEGAKIASSSKPVNILIPRRAKDLKKEDTNVRAEESKPSEPEKVKDFVQDDASSDFSLCIEASNDAVEQKVSNTSHMEVDN